jgi:oligopeptide transport system ATP-binding protein
VGLLDSNPHSMSGRRLTPITGQPPDLAAIPSGCPFHPRCAFATERCRVEEPRLERSVTAHHSVACHHSDAVTARRRDTQR